MNLADYQRAFVRVSFDEQPSEADLEALGDPARFRLYRTMIRARLEGMARVAFKGALELVGEDAFVACFARFLAQSPPNSALIRDVVAAFGGFAERAQELGAGGQRVQDLIAFERTKWRTAYVAARVPEIGNDGVRELDFEGALVLNPVLTLLSLRHAVHEQAGKAPEAPPFTLLVYRPPTVDDVRWYVAEPFFAALLARAEAPHESLAELVREVAEARGTAIDEALLESLATSLTLAVQRGVVIGVR